MKNGRTHLAHKAEHAVDLDTGAIVGVTVQNADAGDTTTSIDTLIEAAEQVEAVRPDGEGIEEVVGDKGYHSNQVMMDLEAIGIRSYISEPDRLVADVQPAGGQRERRTEAGNHRERQARRVARDTDQSRSMAHRGVLE